MLTSYASAFDVKGYVWRAESRRQIEEYGDRISNVANMRIEGNYEIQFSERVPVVVFSDGNTLTAGDGICVHADADAAPDYIIVAITEYKPLMLEIERNVN